ncbi:MAG TPA: hypothetical protein VFL56_05855 [Solirubrobacterales bacterium]|nr:hypothetical protein [Solirubrobacterales bacterium]
MLAAAGLEPTPVALELRDGDDRCDQGQSGIEVAAPRDEVGPCFGSQLDEEPGANEDAVESLDRIRIRRRAVVDEQQCAKALSDVQGATKIGLAQSRARDEQIAFDQPVGEAIARRESVFALGLEIPAGVGEGLNQPQIPRSGRATAGLALASPAERSKGGFGAGFASVNPALDGHRRNGIRW